MHVCVVLYPQSYDSTFAISVVVTNAIRLTMLDRVPDNHRSKGLDEKETLEVCETRRDKTCTVERRLSESIGTGHRSDMRLSDYRKANTIHAVCETGRYEY
ncbi:hypothetical protein TNCV_2436021 [Trichonephila clavipes]|nr:hypothetical protein TNCV_2436021 [Trichonephila clavipes]